MTIDRHRAPLYWLTLAVLALLLSTAGAQAQSAQENAADAARLVRALEVRAGMTIGEIGAGGGELTIALAREVGESGRVYSNELNPKSLQDIGTHAERAGLHNVTLVEGRAAESNLPEQCCDAIFMRNVYHHFADPASMDASLFRSLKPGGRLAVIDFAPDGEESPDAPGRAKNPYHGVGASSLARELKEAGFEVLATEPVHHAVFMVVARRPGGDR